jgi:hypothetical protein
MPRTSSEASAPFLPLLAGVLRKVFSEIHRAGVWGPSTLFLWFFCETSHAFHRAFTY